MQQKKVSSVNKDFQQSLRNYQEIPNKRQTINIRKEEQLLEQEIIINDINANIKDLENGQYQKAFTGISILFTDPNYQIRKHLTFQLFVPEEKDFFGFSILSKKEVWILLLIYFNLINQDKNQYARYLWQSIIKKMSEYLNYEVKEDVLQKVKLFEEKSKLSSSQDYKRAKSKGFQFSDYLKRIEETKVDDSFQEKQLQISQFEILDIVQEKSLLATISENSLGDMNQIPDQNEFILVQEQFETATQDGITPPQNTSIDLFSDLADLTQQQSNMPNEQIIPELSFQQLSQTEEAIRHFSFTNDQVSNQVEISLIQQMEQFCLTENQNEQLNNAQIQDSNIDEELNNPMKEESNKFIKLQSSQLISNKNESEEHNSDPQKVGILNEDNIVNKNLESNQNIDENMERLTFQSFSNIQSVNQSLHIGETPHFTLNQFNFEGQQNQVIQNKNDQLIKCEQNISEQKLEKIEQIDEEHFKKDYESNLDKNTQELNQDNMETKQQIRVIPQQEKENNQLLTPFAIEEIKINTKEAFDEEINNISSKYKTLEEYFEPKSNKVINTNSLNDQQSQIDESILDQNKKRKSRVCRIIKQSQLQNIQQDFEKSQLNHKKQSLQKAEANCQIQEEQKSEEKKKKKKSSLIDSRYDQTFQDQHGSGFRFDIVKAPLEFQEKFQISEVLVPRRSSKRLSYPERNDLEIEKMIIVNNEILNYFKPADNQSKKISDEIKEKNISHTYIESLKQNEERHIISFENDHEQFIKDVVKIQVLIENINDNESHDIVKILSQQFLDRIAIAQKKKSLSEPIIFEDYNYYNNYLQFHFPQMNPIYLPLGSYLINNND